MTTRKAWYANSATEVSTTSSTVWTSGVSKTFTPNASKSYVVFWNCLLQSTSTTVSSRVRLSDGTNTVTQNIEAQEATTPADYRPAGGMYFFSSGGSPSSMTFVIEVSASTGSSTTVRGKNFSLTIVELDALDTTAASAGRSTTTSATPSTKLTLNLTPGTTGDYLLIFSFHTDSTVGNFPDFNVRADTAVIYDNADTPGSKDTANRYPALRMAKVNWSAAAHSADIQYASPFGGTVGIEEARILALRLDVSDAGEAEDLTEGGGAASTSYADVFAGLTKSPNAADYLVLGAIKLNAESTSISAYAQLLEGGTTLLEGVSEHTTSYCTVYHFYAQTRTLAASSTTWKWQTKVESGTDDIFADGAIAIIQLDTATSASVGAGSITLGAITTAATGTLALAGAASITLGAITTSAAGKIALAGAAGLTLGAITVAATGALPVSGAAGISLGAVTLAAAGVLPIAGAAAVTLAAVTLTATGHIEVPDYSIPVARDTMYVVDLTVAPVDLSPTFAPGRSPAVGLVSVGRFAVGVPAITGMIPTYDPPVENIAHFADRDWTTPAGTGDAVFHDGRADQPLEIERTIPLSAYSDTRSTFGSGRVGLVNADRGLRDLILNNSIDGRQVEVLVGSPRAARSTFTTIFKGLAEAWGSATATIVQVALRDRWRKLTDDPRPLFQGNGGVQGGSELTGKPMPLWLGRRSNVPLVPLTQDPFPILMASYLPMDSLDYVKIRGLDMTLAGVVTDIFAQATPAEGTAIVAPIDDTGFALVGHSGEADGQVTAGGRGLYTGGEYLSDHGSLAVWLLEQLGGIDPSEIDATAWAALSARWPGEIGAWFGTDKVAVNQMVDAVMGPQTWWGDTPAGKITAGSLDLPANLGTPQGTLSRSEILENGIDRVDWPGGAPWKRVRLAYDTNNFVTPLDQVIEAPEAWKNYTKEPFRVFPLESVPVRTAHAGAFDGDPIVSPYYASSVAAMVAQVLLRLNEGAVGLYRVSVPDDRPRFPEGHVLWLDHPMVSDVPVPALVAGTSFVGAARKATYLLVA